MGGSALAVAVHGPSRAARPIPWRFVALVGATILAYHQSLLSLVRGLALDTPLAYLGLVPTIAIGLAAAAARRPNHGPPIHDRQLDYIVGVPLFLVVLLANFVLPSQLSTMYWVWRVDLLTLPLFVAGASFILFGTRMTWRNRAPILFLFLAWPYPYTLAIFRWLDAFTLLTVRALAWLVNHVPWATHDPTGDGSRFEILNTAKAFTVSVASQCSGANGLVGFLLIGGSLMLVARGPRSAKAAWLAVGAAVTWALNIVRIMLLFGVGKLWGEEVAIDAFHPFIGLILLNLGLLGLVMALPVFRLRLIGQREVAKSGTVGAAGTKPAVSSRAWLLAQPVVFWVAAVAGLLNAAIVQYGLVASDLGVPRLVPFAQAPPRLEAWPQPVLSNRYEWGRRYFGEDSTWLRFSLPAPGEGAGPLWSTSPIIADVITTSSLGRLEAYGVEACYKFHGYDVRNQTSVDLGGGVKGTVLTWQADKGPRYTTVFWHWPVLDAGKVRYERVTLLLPDGGQTQVADVDVDFESVNSKLDSIFRRGEFSAAPLDERTEELQRYLVSVAQTIVTVQPSSPATS